MPEATVLEPEQIEKRLNDIDVHWSVIGSQLERIYDTPDFKTAHKLVNKIAKLAEKQGHHPDIYFTWGEVRVCVSTHSVGGLTLKDFRLAKAIDKL